MTFLIVGPGAMGCLFAAYLVKAGNEVQLLDYRPERAESINKNGIRVEGITGNFTVKVSAITINPTETPDVVLICVKAFQTRMVAKKIKSWLGPDTMIITLQNGLGNFEVLQEILPPEKILGGITSEGATLLGNGHIKHAGHGETVIGPVKSAGNQVAQIVKSFNVAGFDTKSSENVQNLIWGKLIINAGINALTAITRLKNGMLPQLEGTRKIMKEVVNEAINVAQAKGIQLPYPDPLKRVNEVCQATSDNIASMLQDILKHRITEVDFINGAIVREGQTLGIATNVNHTLTCMVQALHESYKDRITD